MGKIIRRVIAALLAATAIIIAVLPAAGAEAATSTHDFYEYDGSKIVKYLGEETSVTVPDWVTAVGSECFADNKNIQRIILLDSVKSIDFGAFRDCTNLTEAVLPDTIKSIGAEAFANCPNLQAVSIPAKTESLGSGLFAGDTMLSNVPIAEDNEYYVCTDGAIYSSDGKQLLQYLAGRPYASFDMPSSVETIGEYAFWGASNLNQVSISPSVKHIPEYAFANCDGLVEVSVPNSVTRINAFSFADCDNLKFINIPYSVGYIDSRAFNSCKGTRVRFVDPDGNLIKLTYADYADEYVNGEEVPDATEEPTESIGVEGDPASADSEASQGNIVSSQTVESQKYNGSFSGSSDWVSEIDSINYSDNKSDGEMASSMILGGGAFLTLPTNTVVSDGYNLRSAEGEDSYASSSGQNHVTDSVNQVVGTTYAKYNGDDSSVAIPDGITKVASRAFYGKDSLENVSIPDGTTELGDFTFARSGLRSVTIPEGVEKIGYGSFYMCENLNEVNIPSSVKDIELGAFKGSRWFEYWKDPDAVKAKESNTEEANEPTEKLNVNPEDSQKKDAIDKDQLPDYMINSNGVKVPNTAKYPSQNKDALDDYLIVGDGILLAYKGKSSVINIPDSVKHIGPAAFQKNKSITTVILPNSVESIGEDAFNGCTKLSKLTLNEGLHKIEDRAFKNTRMSIVNIPSTVEKVGLAAFDTTENNSPLNTVIFSGKSIPMVSYNETATRLSSKDLRTRAFEGVDNAIVDKSSDYNEAEMFNPVEYGFAGCVYTIDKASGNSNALILEKSLKQPDEEGNIIIDSKVPVYNETYRMDNVNSHAFDDYLNSSSWCEKSPKKVSIDGISSDSLDNLLQSVNESLDNGAIVSGGDVYVSLASDVFPLGSYGSANITDNNDFYILNVKKNDDKQPLIDAYKEAYGAAPPSGTSYLSLDLYDRSGTIPIHKLGNSKMELVLPLPSSLRGKSNVRVACLDDNGLITELSTEVISHDGNDYIGFVTGHCSPYMVYEVVIHNVPKVTADAVNDDSMEVNSNSGLNEELMNSGNNVQTEDIEIGVVDMEMAAGNQVFTTAILQTLNKEAVKGIEVKWFVVVILLSLAGILAIYKPNSQKANSRKEKGGK